MNYCLDLGQSILYLFNIVIALTRMLLYTDYDCQEQTTRVLKRTARSRVTSRRYPKLLCQTSVCIDVTSPLANLVMCDFKHGVYALSYQCINRHQVLVIVIETPRDTF